MNGSYTACDRTKDAAARTCAACPTRSAPVRVSPARSCGLSPPNNAQPLALRAPCAGAEPDRGGGTGVIHRSCPPRGVHWKSPRAATMPSGRRTSGQGEQRGSGCAADRDGAANELCAPRRKEVLRRSTTFGGDYSKRTRRGGPAVRRRCDGADRELRALPGRRANQVRSAGAPAPAKTRPSDAFTAPMAARRTRLLTGTTGLPWIPPLSLAVAIRCKRTGTLEASVELRTTASSGRLGLGPVLAENRCILLLGPSHPGRIPGYVTCRGRCRNRPQRDRT